jgi:hypothetical protein
MTTNCFFQGRIHCFLSKFSGKSGSFEVHSGYRKRAATEERSLLKIRFNLDPAVYPTRFGRRRMTERYLQKNAFMKSNLGGLQTTCDFPTLYITMVRKMWNIFQYASFGRQREKNEIGFFESPDWASILTQPLEDFQELLICLCWIIRRCYMLHWKSIVEHFAKTNNDAELLRNVSRSGIPTNVRELKMTVFGDKFMLTDSSEVLTNRSIYRNIRSEEMQPIRTAGTFFLFACPSILRDHCI